MKHNIFQSSLSEAGAVDQMIDCPGWAMEKAPAWADGYLGKDGLPEPWRSREGDLGERVAGIDRWHANHFVVYRAETAKELYGSYTPMHVEYRMGLFAQCEQLVSSANRQVKSEIELVAHFAQLMPQCLPHPETPPLGPHCPANRGIADDDALLLTGCGFCNEQARIFIRLCQIASIPARMIFLFYSDKVSGHTIAEAYTDEQWMMVDVTAGIAFRDDNGQPLSAVQCHAQANRAVVGARYDGHCQHLRSLSDEALVGGQLANQPLGPQRNAQLAQLAAKKRSGLESKNLAFFENRLQVFGVMNYPLPA